MGHLGLTAVNADGCRRIKVEYRYVYTEEASALHFGASTANMIPVSIGVNTAEIYKDDSEWTIRIYDFTSVNNSFWTGDFTYFGFTTGVGLMAGDSIYIKSIELLS